MTTAAPIRVNVVQTVVVPATDGSDALRLVLRGEEVQVEVLRNRAGRGKKAISVDTFQQAAQELYRLKTV